MDVLLDQQEEEIRHALRAFFERECTPPVVRAAELDAQRISTALWSSFSALGWLGMCLPEALGGQGLPRTYLSILFEEHGRALAPLPTFSTVVPAMVLAAHGNAQQRALLPDVVAGRTVLSFAIQEHTGGWGAEHVQLRATRKGADIELQGSKFFVGHFGLSHQCLVAARLADSGEVVLVLVPSNAHGVRAQALSPMAKDAESTVSFDGVRVPASCIVGGTDGAAFGDLSDLAVVLLASQMEGAARKSTEMAVAYIKDRNAFGQPIAAFQAMQHLAADMVNSIDGTQLLARESTWRMSMGLHAGLEASQAKAYANERCVMVVRSAQQMHGGIGFIAEFDMQLWYRRVVSWSLRCGTTREHRARIADALLAGSGPVRLGMSMYPQQTEKKTEAAL